MVLTAQQQAIRQQLNNFRQALPDANTDLNSLLLLSILDELRLIRLALSSNPNEDRFDQLRDRIQDAKADHDDNDGN